MAASSGSSPPFTGWPITISNGDPVVVNLGPCGCCQPVQPPCPFDQYFCVLAGSPTYGQRRQVDAQWCDPDSCYSDDPVWLPTNGAAIQQSSPISINFDFRSTGGLTYVEPGATFGTVNWANLTSLFSELAPNPCNFETYDNDGVIPLPCDGLYCEYDGGDSAGSPLSGTYTDDDGNVYEAIGRLTTWAVSVISCGPSLSGPSPPNISTSDNTLRVCLRLLITIMVPAISYENSYEIDVYGIPNCPDDATAAWQSLMPIYSGLNCSVGGGDFPGALAAGFATVTFHAL